MKQTIALVDDDRNILTSVAMTLEQEGFQVRTYTDGESALQGLISRPVDLAVLDIKMPRMDGMELLQRLRQRTSLPVIFLTSKDEEVDEVMGLRLGADDYITKPFGTRELVARVKAVLRRFERPTAPSVVKFDNVEIDAHAMQLRVDGELVTTTATEFRLLDYLARHPGRVFSRDHLLDAVWGDARFVTPRSVDVYVRRIREKIEADAETPRYLKTMRGAGYRFELPKSAPASD
jgi:two-component system phosphate regulon response regulator PhoB